MIPSPQGPSRKHSYQYSTAPSYLEKTPDSQFPGSYVDVGVNPPEGVVISYYLGHQNHQPINISIIDSENNIVATFASMESGNETNSSDSRSQLHTEHGINHLIWDMRYSYIADENTGRWSRDIVSVPNKPPSNKARSSDFLNTGFNSNIGNIIKPLVIPGEYWAQLQIGEITFKKSFVLKQDPRINVSTNALKKRFDILLLIRKEVFRIKNADNSIKSVIDQMESWTANIDKTLSEPKVDLQHVPIIKKLEKIRSELTFFRSDGKSDNMTSENPSPLDRKLVSVAQAISSIEGPPTIQAEQVFNALKDRVNRQLSELAQVFEQDVNAFQSRLQQLKAGTLLMIGQDENTKRKI